VKVRGPGGINTVPVKDDVFEKAAVTNLENRMAFDDVAPETTIVLLASDVAWVGQGPASNERSSV